MLAGLGLGILAGLAWGVGRRLRGLSASRRDWDAVLAFTGGDYRVEPTLLAPQPSIKYRFGPLWVQLEEAERIGIHPGPVLEARAEFGGSWRNGRTFEVWSRGFLDPGSAQGGRRSPGRTGASAPASWERFRARFGWTKGDEDLIRGCLGPRARTELETLLDAVPGGGLLVEVGRTRVRLLLVGEWRAALDPLGLVRCLEAILVELVDGITSPRTEEPDEAAAGPVAWAGGGAITMARCQVCGDGFDLPVRGRVHCARCATAHHADCWAFNRGCSTYACGAAPRVA